MSAVVIDNCEPPIHGCEELFKYNKWTHKIPKIVFTAIALYNDISKTRRDASN